MLELPYPSSGIPLSNEKEQAVDNTQLGSQRHIMSFEKAHPKGLHLV